MLIPWPGRAVLYKLMQVDAVEAALAVSKDLLPISVKLVPVVVYEQYPTLKLYRRGYEYSKDAKLHQNLQIIKCQSDTTKGRSR
jgi:hypothetical protein